MAAILIMPFGASILPVLITNALQAISRTSNQSHISTLRRGFWIALGALASKAIQSAFSTQNEASSIAVGLVACASYCIVYIVGRHFDLAFPSSAKKASHTTVLRGSPYRRTTAWRTDASTILVGIPAALAASLLYNLFGLIGAELGAILIMLILLIGHLGFEAGMLREQVSALEQLSALMLSHTSCNRITEKFLKLSAPLISADRTLLWLTNDSQTRLELVAVQTNEHNVKQRKRGIGDTSSRTLCFGEGMIGRIAERRDALILKDPIRDPRFAPTELDHCISSVSSMVLLPMIVGGEVIGVAQFEREGGPSFTKRDLNRVRPLASQAATSMANVRMHQAVYNQAVTDELTSLFNRRHMHFTLSDELRRAERYSRDISLVMLDVDGFKSYNDTYGHPQGDVLLKQLSAILRDTVRNTDIVGRFGGEEFIVLMPETSKIEAWRAAERLRRAVASASFPGSPSIPGEKLQKTISLGVATYPQDSNDGQTLISRADQALYRAKHGGRNRVVAFGDPVHDLSDETEPVPLMDAV